MLNFEKVIRLVKQTQSMFFNNDFEIKEKGKFDYVTQIDLQVQEFMESGLSSLYPEVEFLAEEQENIDLNNDKRRWILDPVDGTTNLMHNFRHSAVSLALLNGNEIEFGVVFNPFTDEMFWAQKGKGAYLNNEPIGVTNTDAIDKSLVAFGTSPYEKDRSRGEFDIIHKVFMQCQDIRRTGSAALDICYVASGRVDAFFEGSLKPWDYAAGAIILSEAGGKITDWGGNALGYAQKSSILATNGLLHMWFLEQLK